MSFFLYADGKTIRTEDGMAVFEFGPTGRFMAEEVPSDKPDTRRLEISSTYRKKQNPWVRLFKSEFLHGWILATIFWWAIRTIFYGR
jgi:hypothetical protein